ncbi:hypothetical protein KO02_09010 [Sphingobacterium sp. ML3W]|uniref:Crp/Fnr family transcriptional regulator n=1 Tax=Sphingobacterium sp. ML3W TaxID=1538644 RepID=UPI0004F8DF04|nr:Crp/Fnr family transcriptional regulator [Sphingobacterium sp. ML3W]AIM36825.1 hypothetical protein KO02_09010 [Sphingobacterium sp. ML3W]
MGTYYTAKKAFHSFYTYWKKVYPPLNDYHKTWLEKNAQVLRVKKGEVLFESTEHEENLYIVLRGILIKERCNTEGDEKQILSVALPNTGFFTTMHYYSQSPALGNIVSIRPGLILKIPYKKINPFLGNDPGIDTLLQLLMNKKKYQLEHLRVMASIRCKTNRFFYVTDHLSSIYQNLNQKELAQLLQISESSIYRAKLLFVRKRLKR